ncbi:MAG: DUF294 nucleotidyltransferase-like domain-containing protein [Burkholderiales bacterium]
MPDFDTEQIDPPLSGLMRAAPVSCLPDTRVETVLSIMKDKRIGSMIVTDPQMRPIGILTLRDVLDRIALAPGALQMPIERVMSRHPLCIPVDSSAYQASLAMIRHGVNHIIVVKNELLAGLVSARDLFGLQHSSVKTLSTAIRSAHDLGAIEAFGRDIGVLSRKMLAQGIATGPLCAFIASLNDLLTQRIVEMEFRDVSIPYCWILMGSEGRSEQTLVTDQDNGLIFSPADGSDPEVARQELLTVARRINLALDRAGYQLCPGDIMAGNPRWCLTLNEWRSRFQHWIASGDPQAILHGMIFFDLRPLHGETMLAQHLRDWITENARHSQRFLHLMAQGALKNGAPLGLLGRFKLDAGGYLDLKINGTTLFTDAGRIFALAAGIDETNTERRLRRAGTALNIPLDEIEAWIAAYYCLQGLRLRMQAAALASGGSADNRLAPRQLHAFDREVLTLAFHQATKLQKRLRMEYSA